jgi:hypothetical protein
LHPLLSPSHSCSLPLLVSLHPSFWLSSLLFSLYCCPILSCLILYVCLFVAIFYYLFPIY